MSNSLNTTSTQKAGGIIEFLMLAFPLIISNLSLSLMNFVDRLFLSWSSPEEVAAAVPAMILAFTIASLFIGISEYTNTFVAQFNGAERSHDIGLATWQGIYFSIFSGIIILSLLPFGDDFFAWINHDPIIQEYEIIYFNWIMIALVFMVINASLASFYSGRGKTKVIMVVTVFSNMINAVLDYALIFGVWGFPEWGIKGAAVATLIAQATMTIIYMALFLSNTNHEQFKTRSRDTAWLNIDLFKRLMRFGAPSGMVFLLDHAGFTAFIMMIGQLGTVELAATNIVIGINMLAFFPMMGALIAVSTLVGQYIGKNDHDTAEKSTFSAFICIEIYMIMFALIYYFFPEQLMQIFHSKDTESGVSFDAIANMGAHLLLCVAIYQIFDGMIITFSGALRGAGDTMFSMWTSAISMWCLFVPGSWIVLKELELGLFAVWVWATIYFGILGMIYFLRFKSGCWRNIQVIPDEALVPEPLPNAHSLDA